MIFEIDFLCSDYRPLLSKEGDLVDFLKPLHRHNTILKDPVRRKWNLLQKTGLWIPNAKEKKRTKTETGENQEVIEKAKSDDPAKEDKKTAEPKAEKTIFYKPYYRGIGELHTNNMSSRTFFKTKSSIKLPDFEEHDLKFRSDKYRLLRENRVYRDFSVDDYGVVNRLRLGFYLNLIPQKKKEKMVINEQKNCYELLKHLFNITLKINDKPTFIPLSELGKQMALIISDSTYCKSKSAKGKEKELDSNVFPITATAVLIYKKGELKQLPEKAMEFQIANYPKKISLSYYDFWTKSIPDPIRVYFVEYGEGCSRNYLLQLKSHLIDLRTSFFCLEDMLFKTGITNWKQDSFVDNQIEKIQRYWDDKQFSFLDLGEHDQNEIFPVERRRKIDKKIQDFDCSTLYIQ